MRRKYLLTIAVALIGVGAVLATLRAQIVWGAPPHQDQPDGSIIASPQTTNGTWGPGTITATSNVVINAGVVITIAPNTTIRVVGNYLFTVNGDLHSDGPITFTSPSATPGAWQGVAYAPGSTGYLNEATIEYAQHALVLNTANPIAISNSTLRYNRHVLAANQTAYGAGLVILQGNHLISGTSIYSNAVTASGSGAAYGAGIYIAAGAPQVRNCLVYQNTATGASLVVGGGIGILSGSPLIAASEITTNTITGSGNAQLKLGAGIGVNGNTTAVIRDNRIAGNAVAPTDGYAGGGGMGLNTNAAVSRIERNVIYANSVVGPDWCEGAGLDVWETGSALIVNNLVISNTTPGLCASPSPIGGGINVNAGTPGVYLYNNTFVGNRAASGANGRGGGMHLQLANSTSNIFVFNNVIVNNYAGGRGGGVYRETGTVNYNDIYGNMAPANPNWYGTIGANNLSVDPLFATTGDLASWYHLRYNSPVIDRGTNSGTGLPTDDYDGESRPLGATWEMGFDEVAPSPVCSITLPADTAVTMGDGNQTLPFTVINRNQVGGRSIDTVQLEFDAGVYDLSRGIAAPENWTIAAIRQAGQGQTWVRYVSNDAAYDIDPGESLTFDVPLIGVSNGLFPSAATDQTDALQAARTYVRDGTVDFGCTPLPTWSRKGLAVAVTPAPLSLAVGQTLVVEVMVTNRSSVSQSNITTTLTYTGSGGLTLVGGPTPDSLTLASGTSAIVVYTYTASSNGYVVFTSNAANANVSSKPGVSDVVYIGDWTASVELGATQVVSGQLVAVRMTVQNNTEPSAGNVVPTLTPTGTATITLVSGPSPHKINSIPPGGSGTFEWTYRITGPVGATFAFSGYATDKDGRMTNTSTSAWGVISKYAVIPDPSQVPAGSTNFAIVFTVYNNGGTVLDRVVFSIPPGWSVSEAASSGGYNGNWNKNYNPGQDTFTFWSPSGGQDLPIGQWAAFSLYFTAGPNPPSDTPYDFGAALFNNNVVQGGATPTVLVTKYRVVLLADPASGIPADGASTSTITATVTQAGVPQEGVVVQFETTAGTLSGPTATTDAQGRAVIRLTAPISTDPVTATVTARYLTAYDAVDVGFIGYNDANPLYVGGTLNPVAASPGDPVALALSAINLGTRPITLTPATIISFTDGIHIYTATLAAPVSIPTGATRPLTFTSAVLDPDFGPGSYYPTLEFSGWITSPAVSRVYVRPVSDPFAVGIASLRASLTAYPALAVVGQPITVTMVVTNVGVNTASVVTPSALVLGGTASATLASGPVPISATDLISGRVATFTWTYTATSAGLLDWSGRAQGIDALTGLPVSSPPATSNEVSAIAPASLAAALAVPVSTVNVGQSLSVTMWVTNTGDAAARDLSPGPLATGGTGSATYTSGPDPGTLAWLLGGETAAFTWGYLATGPGVVTWNGAVTGTDAIAGWVVTATAAPVSVTVQRPAALTCTLVAAPSPVGTGSPVYVTMTVTNTGEATALAVNPSALTPGGTGSATYFSGPSGSPVTITGGTSAAFGWTYVAATAGTVNWSGNASGTDANSGEITSSLTCASADVTVQDAARLVAAIAAAPVVVGQDELVTVTMVVTNTGTRTALNVTPSALTLADPQLFTLEPGYPQPASLPSLDGGATGAFVWVYRAASNRTGDETWSGSASGTDAGSGLPVSSPPATSNVVHVFEIVIDKDVRLPHTGAIAPGEQLTYTIAIRNTGNNNVNVTAITDTLPAGFTYITTTAATWPPDSPPMQVGQTVTWDYGTSRPQLAQHGGTITITFVAQVGSVGQACNSAGVTLQQGGRTYTRDNLACVTVTWPVYEIVTQAGPVTIRVRLRLEDGRPIILSWEFLP